MSRIVFRADGALAIGSGHVMRSLALAAEFQAGGWTVGFAATAETFATVPALAAAKIEKLTLPEQAEGEADALARQWPTGANIFVVDHYGRDAAFELACRPWATRIVAIDDLADRRHDADVLVDGANPEVAYRTLVPDTCEVLAGTNFAVLHSEFRRMRGQALARRGERRVERILVSFGQTDPSNATAQALAALAKAGFSGRVDVVLGPAVPHLSEIRAAAQPDVHVHVGTDAMAKLMTDADLAIGAGGVTAWERCCLGLPSIIVALAENQRQTIAVVTEAGAGIDAGLLDARGGERLNRVLREVLGDAGRRAAIARAAAGLVDGEGARRVMLAAIGPVPAKSNKSVRLRLASLDDEAWLFALQRKPGTRRFANDPAAPSANDHHRWLDATLSDPQRLLTVVEVDGRRAAMLRLDSGVDADRINIAVDPNYHRQGVGAAALELAARLRPGRTLEAEILPENAASLALFLGARYRRAGERLFRREPA